MKDFGSAGCESVGFIIAQVVEKFSFDRIVRIRGVNTVDIGPDDEFFRVHDVRDDGAGKIGTVAAERGDAAIGSGANETGDDGDEASFQKRKKNVAAAFSGFFEMRLGIAERVARKYEIGRGNRNGGDSGFFESSGKETSAETLAEGSETVGEFRGDNNEALRRDFVEEIATEKLEAAADTIVLLFAELKI
jgi:hypothetical protein